MVLTNAFHIHANFSIILLLLAVPRIKSTILVWLSLNLNADWGMAHEHECPDEITCHIWRCNSLLAGSSRNNDYSRRPRLDSERQRLVSQHEDARRRQDVRGFLRVHPANCRIYHRVDVDFRPDRGPDP